SSFWLMTLLTDMKYFFSFDSGMLYGPRLLISHVGGSVTINCYYLTTSVNRHGRKYWCKESRGACQTVISSNRFTLQDYSGRVSINDRPRKGLLQVTMTHTLGEVCLFVCLFRRLLCCPIRRSLGAAHNNK
uniref:Immunoglobulin V-set domain-containing protein n=1 Tax=Varanus komodoensis TaxID=61221 RepID=A0A8D2KWF6_VARKO